MRRTTEKDLVGALSILNGALQRKRTGYSVQIGYRYNYKALDLWGPIPGDEEKRVGCLRTLQAGMSSGECLTYIYAMIEGISLSTRRRKTT